MTQHKYKVIMQQGYHQSVVSNLPWTKCWVYRYLYHEFKGPSKFNL